MALEQVKGYFRSRLPSLGFVEWSDGFNFTNIPKTLLNDRWHLEMGRVTNVSQNQPLQLRWPVTLRLFKSPGRDPRTLMDDAILSLDIVLADLLTAENRVAYSDNFKNLYLDSFRLEQLGETNDNGVIIVIELSALIVMAIS